VLLKGRAEFWENPVNIGLGLGGEGLATKLLDAGFGIGKHVRMVSNTRDSRQSGKPLLCAVKVMERDLSI
jgi:hypothetical protein